MGQRPRQRREHPPASGSEGRSILSRAKNWIVLAPALAVATVFILTVVDPFEFESATKRQSASIFYRIYAAMYQPAHRDKIAVVLLDDETVNVRSETFPPSHLLHGDVLDAILRYEPLAVLVDIYFIHGREGDHFARTQNVIEAYNSAEPKVPLFMVAAGSSTQALQAARNELLWLAAEGKVRLVSGEIEAEAGEPPLYRLKSDSGPMPAAPAMHRMLCTELGDRKPAGIKCPGLETHGEEFEVVWGLRPAPFNCQRAETTAFRHVCKDTLTSWPMRTFQLFYEAMIPGIWRPTDPMPIPYHTTISAEDVLDGANRATLEPLLKDKIVVYGAHLALVKDQVFSPVHGNTDGAYIHAMALDNLLTFGEDVVHRSAGHHTFRKEWTEFQPAALMLIAGLLIGLNRWRLLRKHPQAEWSKKVKDADKWFLRWVYWALIVIIVIAGLLEFTFWNISPFNWLALIIVVHVAHQIEKRFFNPGKWAS